MRTKNSFRLSLDSYKEEQEYINNIKYKYKLIAQKGAAVQINSKEFFNKLELLKKLYNIILQTSYKNAAERIVILMLPFRSEKRLYKIEQAMGNLRETYMDALGIIKELNVLLKSSYSKPLARL